MKVAIAQINCIVGDLSGNTARILDYASRAQQLGASVDANTRDEFLLINWQYRVEIELWSRMLLYIKVVV